MTAAGRHAAITESARRISNGWWVENTAVAKGYGQVIEPVDAERVKVEWRNTGVVECEWRDELRAVADDPGDLPQDDPAGAAPGYRLPDPGDGTA
jgi:hypothetical protein